jgi:DsbC/DsbD-like thiol-disulfide interchange protein
MPGVGHREADHSLILTRRMTMRILTTLALVFTATLAFSVHPAAAQAMKSDAKVKAEVSADKPDGSGQQTVTIKLSIDKGWHLYANPVGNPDLASTQTKLAIVGKGEAVKIDYPAGVEIKDDTIGNYRIYKGDVAIKAVVKRAAGETGPVEMTLFFQACDDSTCLLPATVKLTVP